MRRYSVSLFLLLWMLPVQASAAPCLVVTLTGTQGGPNAFNGLAGSGTLVRYGDDANDCGALALQFDAGRGTTMRLSQIGITPGRLDAVFFTHLHSDDVDGFADLMQLRWYYEARRPKIDVVCSDDVAEAGRTLSCRNLVAHIGDAYVASGEIAQRVSEDKARPAGGPAVVAVVRPLDRKSTRLNSSHVSESRMPSSA